MILIGGGSRSGKSAMALRIMRDLGPRMGFIATAQAWDDEMRERIAIHRAERGADMMTWEEPLALAQRIAAEDGAYDAIVVDCLTLWLTNIMLAEGRDVNAECAALIAAAAHARTQIILVTNEVGAASCRITHSRAASEMRRAVSTNRPRTMRRKCTG